MNRFLIIRLGALGDLVHAIPVAAALRRAFPTAQIDWLVNGRHRGILDLVPVIDQLLVIDDRGSTNGGTSLVGAIRMARRARYDVAIDLQSLINSAILAHSSGAHRVIGFAARLLREPMARLFYREMHDPGGGGMFDPGEARHVVQTNLGLLGALSIAPEAPEFPIAPVTSAVAREACERSGGPYVLFNPGAGWPNKRWPPDRMGAVAAAVRERHGLTSWVSWGPGERELAVEVAACSGGAASPLPETSVADLVALARGAALMISGDTGPTHIAAAVGTPIVGLFGPSRPERNGPWSSLDISLSRAKVCQCLHRRRCRLQTMCLLDISVPEVVSAVERRLAAEHAGG